MTEASVSIILRIKKLYEGHIVLFNQKNSFHFSQEIPFSKS